MTAPRETVQQRTLFEVLQGDGKGWDATPWRVETPRGLRGVGYWLPVLIPLALFAQLALLGLRPGLSESARLAAAEERLVGEFEAELARAQHIGLVLRAHSDPIYLERERRRLVAADSDLLGR